MKLSKDNQNTRKGANGVVLKKFEATLQQIFSLPSSSSISHHALDVLSPHYSVQPPRLTDLDMDELMKNAVDYWREIGLFKSNNKGECAATEDFNDDDSKLIPPWPFDKDTSLPSIGHVRDSQDPANTKAKTLKTKTGKDIGGVGDIMRRRRAWKKEIQLSNLIHCILSLFRHKCLIGREDENEEDKRSKFRIVDFAGGTGHLAVPLALLLPNCDIVCVDLKKWSLDLLHRRVDGSFHEEANQSFVNVPDESQALRVLPNLHTYYGSIQSYSESFDIGIALHACGEASDWVLRKCLEKNASFVVCSCCCGKIRRNAANPYTFQSTGGNKNEIEYPQSRAFACIDENNPLKVVTPDMFDEIAKAADYSELGDLRESCNACRRAAKSLVEWDRLLFVKECMSIEQQEDCLGGNVVLTRMLPWDASTKNDILIGWQNEKVNPYHDTVPKTSIPRDESSDCDFQTALNHLFETTDLSTYNESQECTSDWSLAEEEGINREIKAFLQSETTLFRFPTGMGSRRRKLIHSIAEKEGLFHWGEGKRDRDKIVIIAKRAEAESNDKS